MTVASYNLVGAAPPRRYYICDTEAELPASGLNEGDLAYAIDTEGFFKATDATTWVEVAGTGGGAPTDVNYLVGTASGGLSAEIAVGTSPGGELGGTWAFPTVDATHSGSAHPTFATFAKWGLCG